jgi:VWFA-related protein
MPIKRTLLALLSFALLTATADPKLPQLGETIEVSIVNVDVVVTDRQGNRIRGLTAADFEVFEAGKKQPISNFAEYSAPPAEGSTTVGGSGVQEAAAAPRQPRTIVVFLERISLTQLEAKKFTASILELLRATVGKGDQVALVVWTRNAINTVAFSDDLTVVEAALAEYAAASGDAVPNRAAQQARYLRSAQDFEAGVAERYAEMVAGRSFRPTPRAQGPNMETKVLNGDSDTLLASAAAMTMAMSEMKVRVAAINSTIDMMAGSEGKKVLLLATHRLGEVAGAEYLFNAGAAYVTADMRQQFGTEQLTKSIIDNANASGVTIYPLFPEGIRSTFEDASIGRIALPKGGEALDTGVTRVAENLTAMNETTNLARIAGETGGAMAWSVADIVKVLPQVASDMTDYYSLAYRVTGSRTDRARDIVVKTRNRDYKVRARHQFVEKSNDTLMKDRVTAALFGVTPASSIDVSATTGTAKKVRTRTSIPISVRIPIKSLTALPEGDKYRGAFSVYVASAADLDEVSDFTRNTQPFEFNAADLEKAMAGHFTYDLDLVINGAARRVAIGVYDEVSTSAGFVTIPVDAGAVVDESN